jgi:hypothetical protein
MLLGCGCHCDPNPASDIQSGSFRSESIGSSAMESIGSLDPGTPGYCGACYNLPAEWRVTLSSAWWNYQYPARDHDCRAALGGTFTLRPYGAATISPGARLYLDQITNEYCTVWKSDELAQFVSRRDRLGNLTSGCTNSINNYARIELVSATALTGNAPCNDTYFVLFVWWLRPGMFVDQEQEGQTWEWTVPCPSRNCVRCFGAQVGPPRGFFNAYGLNNTYVNEWQTIGVCPG